MTHHRLKTWPQYYDAVAAGRKTFEFRVNDRGFAAGDRVTLACYDPAAGTFDGRELTFGVPYVMLTGRDSGTLPGYAILSLVPCRSGS